MMSQKESRVFYFSRHHFQPESSLFHWQSEGRQGGKLHPICSRVDKRGREQFVWWLLTYALKSGMLEFDPVWHLLATDKQCACPFPEPAPISWSVKGVNKSAYLRGLLWGSNKISTGHKVNIGVQSSLLIVFPTTVLKLEKMNFEAHNKI